MVCVRSTLPALAGGGAPSSPVIDRAGRQVLFNRSSAPSSDTGRTPSTKGNLSHTAEPSASAATWAWRARSGGTSTWKARGRISPVASFSSRDSRVRRMRNEEGTTPEASPECTPSRNTSTRRSPPTMPRREVVSQSWS